MSVTGRNYIVILTFAILGFLITGIECYPWTATWDSAFVITNMVSDGQPWLTNWMGWYYPYIIYGLYKISDNALAIGCFQNFLYWLGITLLSLALFKKSKFQILWFVIFAFFPGTLAFITGITNNALLFSYVLLGVSLFFFYRRCYRKKWILVLSYLFLLQSVFIRREAIIYVPIIMLFFSYFELHGKMSKWKALFISFAIAYLPFTISLPLEKTLTNNIPGYHYINTVDFTAMFDMVGMSHFKGQIVFPAYVFKKQYRSEDILMDSLKNDKDGIFSDIGSFWSHSKVLEAPKSGLIEIENIPETYIHNIKYYIMFRSRIIYRYLSARTVPYYEDCYITCHDNRLKNYPVHSLSNIAVRFSILSSVITPPILIYCLTGLFLIILSMLRYIPFNSKRNRNIFIFSWLFLFAIMFLYMISCVSVQIRYIYPSCIFMYLMQIYAIAIFVERNKFSRMSR